MFFRICKLRSWLFQFLGKILHKPSHASALHLIRRHYILSVGSYRRSKRGRNDASDDLNLESSKLAHISTPISRSTVPDMTSLFTSGWQLSKFKKRPKMPPQTASGGISREKFMLGSPNFTWLSGITWPTNLPDMTSLVTSSRQQNAIKY